MTSTNIGPAAREAKAAEARSIKLKRIRAAIYRMPYSAAIPLSFSGSTVVTGPTATPDALDLDKLGDYLEALHDVLRGVAQRNDQVEAEHRELVRQRAAIRAFLGIEAGA